jgi:hypothetical protein
MLADFLGVLPILTPPLCALAFIMCPKSNPIVVIKHLFNESCNSLMKEVEETSEN